MKLVSVDELLQGNCVDGVGVEQKQRALLMQERLECVLQALEGGSGMLSGGEDDPVWVLGMVGQEGRLDVVLQGVVLSRYDHHNL